MSDVKNRMECPGTTEGQRDLAPLYLAGKLTAKEAEAFEMHYLGCEKCREDVTTGAALRELYGRPAVAASASASIDSASTRRMWLPLAAAAAIAFVAVGVWQVSRRSIEQPGQPPSRIRAPECSSSKSKPERRSLELSGLTSHPGAAAYEVQVFASDGTRVWSAESDEPRLSIGPAVLPSPEPAQVPGIRGPRARLDATSRRIERTDFPPRRPRRCALGSPGSACSSRATALEATPRPRRHRRRERRSG